MWGGGFVHVCVVCIQYTSMYRRGKLKHNVSDTAGDKMVVKGRRDESHLFLDGQVMTRLGYVMLA